ncbi:hypothetical protein BCS91_25150 (plasmid) [Vibrio cyclitrophicus]
MTLPPIKIGLIALMGLAAVGMGYTTLFPDVESEYAGAPAERAEQDNPIELGSEALASTSLSTLSVFINIKCRSADGSGRKAEPACRGHN